MRRIALVGTMIGLVASVIAVSILTMRREDCAAVKQLRDAEGRLAQDTVTALGGYLDSFDRDTRLLAALAAGTRRRATNQRAQDDAILDAFQALATVVPQYRTIALFHAGRAPIVAVDPTEDRATIAPALVAASEGLAREATREARTVRAGPLSLAPGRSFYLYAAPAAAEESVVVTSDAGLMLEAVSRRPTGTYGLVVLDPTGAVWVGCERHERCRLAPPGSDDAAALLVTIDAASRAAQPVDVHPGVARLGLPTEVIVGVAPPRASALGTWSVVVVTAAAELAPQRHGFLWRLVLTSGGVALAMLAIGIVILRQQARAAALAARVQAAEDVARLQRQLVRAEKLVTVGVLSAGIAHDIGTPLAVVRGRAEHMLERRFDARDVEDLRAVVGEIDRIASTIRQVLDFSREQPVTLGRTDTGAAIERAVELLAWRLAAKNVIVDVDAPGELPAVAAAADQLEQVIVNLLLNACDASKPRQVIRVTAALDDARRDRLRIQVVDVGNGIPPHHLNAVFDPYFTTKKRGEGTGLGLAIVSQIVRSHKGEIALRSAVGVGTVATVMWPIAAIAGDAPERKDKVA